MQTITWVAERTLIRLEAVRYRCSGDVWGKRQRSVEESHSSTALWNVSNECASHQTAWENQRTLGNYQPWKLQVEMQLHNVHHTTTELLYISIIRLRPWTCIDYWLFFCITEPLFISNFVNIDHDQRIKDVQNVPGPKIIQIIYQISLLYLNKYTTH